MKAESTVLVGQKEITCQEEKIEGKRRPWIFFLVFWYRTCLFAYLVFAGLHLMWVPLRSSPQNGGSNFRLSSHCRHKCSLMSSSRRISKPTNFQIQVLFLLPPGVGGRTHPFRLFHTESEMFGPSGFFFLVIFNYCSHSLLTDWPTTTASARVTQKSAGRSRRISVCFSLLVFLLSLPQKLSS